ncbi:Poly(ADP-ribose) glycohydrolase ARH3 [Chionoecetes opilio]|uniref:ADP-ribosylhydrolase ARH3 n=1 Tax=Chionoecetes opilio TaxID=41210 RepID=A0A8J5CZ10_CHIOP|nr:Poly(ADP-ribose) glycohydrolase ARH3 [Chionoecetes opilio]
MALVEAVEVMAGRFRGCLVGGLMGDCLGAPFEGEPRASPTMLNTYFKRLNDPNLKVPYKPYTDDTAMMRCVALSLIEEKGYVAQDMAKRFVKEFFAEPKRGYGSNVVDVFAVLRATKFRDVYSPAAMQFNGRGSYGNGGAMRVAPIALFCHASTEQELVDTAKDMALLTHANRLGYNGAVLQCLAVHEALHTPKNDLNCVIFIENLIKKMKKVEQLTKDDIIDEGEEPFVYVKKLEKVLELLERKESIDRDQVEDELGVNISAHESVPTAIYSFVRASYPIPNIEAENEFQRTLHYAISLGGDTDTIASMAGSIAGAYYGMEKIPENLQRHCEALSEAVEQADQLNSTCVKDRTTAS